MDPRHGSPSGAVRAAAACAMLVVACASAAPAAPLFDANSLIPRTPPAARFSDWTAAPGRTLVSLQTDDGTLRGWRYAASDAAAPTVLIFGGNGYSIATIDSALRGFAAQGSNVVEYDYPGYGFSEGHPDMLAMQRDALDLYDATVKAEGDAPIVVCGYSLGTAFASYVASQRGVRGLVLFAPFSSIEDEYEFITKKSAAPIARGPNAATLDEAVFVTRSQAPLLIVHGEADQLISIDEGRKDFKASSVTRKTFVAIPGADHDILELRPTLAAFKAFIASLRSPA